MNVTKKIQEKDDKPILIPMLQVTYLPRRFLFVSVIVVAMGAIPIDL